MMTLVIRIAVVLGVLAVAGSGGNTPGSTLAACCTASVRGL